MPLRLWIADLPRVSQWGMLAGMLDVPGILRRVRRLTGLSQRQVAAALGVGQSRIARAEATGDCTVSLLCAALELADLSLTVLDASGRLVVPMRADGCRNRVGNRLPPYTDPVAANSFTWQQGTGHYDRPVPPFTHYRDRTQEPAADHPPDHETFDVLERRRRQRRVEEQRRARRANPPPADFDQLCHCECERACLPACDCQCEPRDSPDPG